MAFGKGSVGTGGQGISEGQMKPRKQMASGKGESGAGAVKSFPPGGHVQTQAAAPGGHMNDGARGAKPTLGSGQQAAPDHGGMGKDHYSRDGKA